MSPSSPLLSPQEEFQALCNECDDLKDLSQLETRLSNGISRVARSLAQRTVRKHAEAPKASSPGEAFPPSA